LFWQHQGQAGARLTGFWRMIDFVCRAIRDFTRPVGGSDEHFGKMMFFDV
jgi:hypothetical protein